MRSNRRMGGAGMRRGLRGGSGVVAAAAPSFDRSDLGLVVGFDPAPAYLTKDGSDRVALMQARWSYDLTGTPVAAYSVGQGTGTAKPLYEATGILGVPALYYTTDDYLITSDDTLANLLDGLQAVTTYTVIDRDVELAVNTVVALGDSGATANFVQNRMTFSAGTAKSSVVRSSGAGATATLGSTSDAAGIVRITYQFTGSADNTWVGSSLDINGAADTRSPTCNRFIIGSSRQSGAYFHFMAGRIGMVLVYAQAHDAAQRAYVWGLLQAHYPALA